MGVDFEQYFTDWEATLAKEAADEAAAEKAVAMDKDKQARLKDAFRKIDKDGSKSIEMKEFVTYMVANESSMGDEAYFTSLKEIDATNSGTISLAEFESWSDKQG